MLDAINSAPIVEADPGVDIAVRRAQLNAMTSQLFLSMTGEVAAMPIEENCTITGRCADIPVRVYQPPRGTQEPLPCHVFLHGGAWWLGDLDQTDSFCRLICGGANCVVVSVDYSLAPESQFPIAVEECYDVVNWLAQHPGSFNIDKSRLSVGGASAGGNLAAAVALMLRDRDAAVLCCQILEIPVTESALDSDSVQQFAQGYLLTRDAMVEALGYYLQETDLQNPYAAPLLAQSLVGLAPALVITAQYDVLRDQGEAYGRRLQEAGVPTKISRYDGMIHGFSALTKVLPKAVQCIEEQITFLKEVYSLGQAKQENQADRQ